jgi:hypothetical protein
MEHGINYYASLVEGNQQPGPFQIAMNTTTDRTTLTSATEKLKEELESPRLESRDQVAERSLKTERNASHEEAEVRC